LLINFSRIMNSVVEKEFGKIWILCFVASNLDQTNFPSQEPVAFNNKLKYTKDVKTCRDLLYKPTNICSYLPTGVSKNSRSYRKRIKKSNQHQQYSQASFTKRVTSLGKFCPFSLHVANLRDRVLVHPFHRFSLLGVIIQVIIIRYSPQLTSDLCSAKNFVLRRKNGIESPLNNLHPLHHTQKLGTCSMNEDTTTAQYRIVIKYVKTCIPKPQLTDPDVSAYRYYSMASPCFFFSPQKNDRRIFSLQLRGRIVSLYFRNKRKPDCGLLTVEINDVAVLRLKLGFLSIQLELEINPKKKLGKYYNFVSHKQHASRCLCAIYRETDLRRKRIDTRPPPLGPDLAPRFLHVELTLDERIKKLK
ncbi:hypothetical protein L9F63_023788, partial [Diploptera punctata]